MRNPLPKGEGNIEDQKKNKTCPIKAAKALTPWWMMEILDYDGLELHPVRDQRWDDDTMGERPFNIPDHHETWCEPCDIEDAHFFSVYGHCNEGGICCFEDFPRLDQARDFALQLLKGYPHLKEFGLLDCSGSCQLDLFSETL